MPELLKVVPGDIIAIQGRGWLADGILHATHSSVSHVGMVIGSEPPVVIEALTRVKTRLLSDTIASANHAWILHDNFIGDAEKTKLVAAACRFSADGYGYVDLLLQLLDCLTHTRYFTQYLGWFLNKVPICSFVVAAAYASIGYSFNPPETGLVATADNAIREFDFTRKEHRRAVTLTIQSITPNDIFVYAGQSNSGFTITQIS